MTGGTAVGMSQAETPQVDPIAVEVIRYRLEGIAEEMQASLLRLAFSPIVKEGMDASAALFLPDGRSLVQSTAIPLHLGALIPAVAAIIERFPVTGMAEGDAYLVNDPYHGGTHLPDIAVVAPLFHAGRLVMLAASIMHYQDVGGMRAGSVPTDATEIFQEGLRLPPTRFRVAGQTNEALMELLTLNVRLPEVFSGDIAAQLAAATAASQRLGELCNEYGAGRITVAAEALIRRAEALSRAAIADLPDGVYRYEDALDNDGVRLGERLPIRLAADIRGDRLRLDFSGTAAQTAGPVNCAPSGSLAAAFLAVRGLADPATPTNAGCLAPVHLHLPEGSLLNPRSPAPVNARMATVKLVTNVILGALSQARPGLLPAPNCGASLILAFSGTTEAGRRFVVSEIIAGGAGATPFADGADVVSADIGNAMNMPAEALEAAAPVWVRTIALRDGSGGSGRFRGGRGTVREYEARVDGLHVTHRGERFYRTPPGILGGGAPQPAVSVVIRADGAVEPIPSKANVMLNRGDRLRIETAGGAGYGAAGD